MRTMLAPSVAAAAAAAAIVILVAQPSPGSALALGGVVPGCECTSVTWGGGVLLPRGLPLDYGTSCEAWDDGACSEHSCGEKKICDEMWPDAAMGTWCCSAWCYVDPATCDLDDVEMSALDPDGVNGQTLYYSYAACKAAETRYTPDTCPWEKDLGWESAFSLCRSEAISSGAPEIFLIQDLSGSYGDDVAMLNSMMDDLGKKLSAQFGAPRIGVGSFVDNPNFNGAAGDHCYKTHLPITENFAAVKAAYSTLTIKSGGDGPESLLDAIYEAAVDGTIGWAAGSKIILVTTDAETHIGPSGTWSRCTTNEGAGYITIDAVRDALTKNDINVIFAVTSGLIGYYQNVICQLGRGQVVELRSDSSNLVEALTSSACVLSTVPKATVRVQLRASKAETLRIMPPILSAITGVGSAQVVATSILENLPNDMVDATFSILFSDDTGAQNAVADLRVEGDRNPIKTELLNEHRIQTVTVVGVESGVAQISSVTEGAGGAGGTDDCAFPTSSAQRVPTSGSGDSGTSSGTSGKWPSPASMIASSAVPSVLLAAALL